MSDFVQPGQITEAKQALDRLRANMRLSDRIVESRFRHVHRWQVHDLLMWDNCTVQHLASFDYQWPKHRRFMHRVTVGGTIPA